MQQLETQQNTLWRPVFWEPVEGSGERLMVGVLIEREGEFTARQTIRDDVLDFLYGKAAAGPRALIRAAFDVWASLGKSVAAIDWPYLGMAPGELRHTYTASISDALRQAVLMFSSLGNPDKLDDLEASDAPTQEDSNRRFATEVRTLALDMRPDLEAYFGRSAVLIEGGEPTRFGFCSPRTIVHFGVLSPVRQSSGVRDARARLWELHRAREWAGLKTAALLFAAPRQDDPTLSTRQLEAARRNLAEIEREADSYKMRFVPVTSAVAGAEALVELA